MSVADKKALRQEMVARRLHAHAVTDQTPATDALTGVLADAAGPISFYWPIRTEIDPRPVFRAISRRQVCLPITHGHAALTFRRWFEGVEMVNDGFGVPIPVESSEELTPRTLVVPMLAFDTRGHRLGYGAGHYDRTLEKLRKDGPVLAIGFAFSAQQTDGDLPIEPTDQPLDMIVTEKDVLRFS